MSHSHDSYGITTPITKAGRVAINAVRDDDHIRRCKRRLGNAQTDRDVAYDVAIDDECYSIQQFELCVRRRDSTRLPGPSDTDWYVFSAANGIPYPGKRQTRSPLPASGKDGDRQQLRDALEFAGVASNRAIYDPSNRANESMLAVQVGGLTTIYNNGAQTIHAGDLVAWDLPAIKVKDNRVIPQNRIRGVPRSKLLFSTVPILASDGLNPRAEFSSQELTSLVTGADGDTEEIVASLQSLNRRKYDLRRRVIGKAMSTARAGKPFDIYLSSYAC